MDDLNKIKNNTDELKKQICNLTQDFNCLAKEKNNDRIEINNLISDIKELQKSVGLNCMNINYLKTGDIKELNCCIDEAIDYKYKKSSKFPKLNSEEIVISSVAGIIAGIIDILLVGTPEIEKIYNGKEKFNGSIITKLIRNMGNEKLNGFTEFLSKKFKVPYDISVVPNGMYPQNHRLRSLGHDPLIGIFFAIIDIILNTTTFIDNSGYLRIVKNINFPQDKIENICSIIYYVGHIISDTFTARGIPVPGFFTTQFFVNGNPDKSIAKIAEDMYINGYDIRHLATMSIPLVVKNIIINIYFKLIEVDNYKTNLSLALREKHKVDKELKKEKMLLIANSIAVGSNLIKFFAPPYSCNLNSLNLPEWIAFLRSCIIFFQVETRDTIAEDVMINREEIDEEFKNLLNN